jgi:hypothetical protein
MTDAPTIGPIAAATQQQRNSARSAVGAALLTEVADLTSLVPDLDAAAIELHPATTAYDWVWLGPICDQAIADVTGLAASTDPSNRRSIGKLRGRTTDLSANLHFYAWFASELAQFDDSWTETDHESPCLVAAKCLGLTIHAADHLLQAMTADTDEEAAVRVEQYDAPVVHPYAHANPHDRAIYHRDAPIGLSWN